MDISNNYNEDMDDLPELIPMEPPSIPTEAQSPFLRIYYISFNNKFPIQ